MTGKAVSMNMISQLRQRLREDGQATITPAEYDQLQAEWITRAGAEDVVTAAKHDLGVEFAELIRQAQRHMTRTPEADAVSVALTQFLMRMGA